MRLFTKRFLGVVALAGGGLCCASASASPIEFATFDIINANQPFAWTNNTTSGTVGVNPLVGNPIDVQFTFTAQSGFSETLDASLVISVSGPSAASATSGHTVDQPLNQTITLSFTDPTLSSGQPGYNILTATLTNGDLYGVNGSVNGTTAGQNDGIDGGSVTFTSDFGTFDNTSVDNSLVLGLSTLSSPLHVTNGTGGNPNLLNSFVANVDGQFNADIGGEIHNTIPEPASMGLLGLGAIGLLARRRRA